jgi:hypothetical protein
MKNIILTLLFVVMSLSINSQILQTEASTTAGSSSMAFIDGSSAFNYNAFNGAGKGILFPSTDLTNINAADVFDSGTVGTSTYNPNYYDGLVVYNTGTGSVIGEMGTGSPDVAPGFYYYANPNRTAWDGGTWTPLGGGAGGGSITLDATPKDSDLSIDGVQEKVVRLSGTADGTTTHIDLGTSVLAANTVGTFRKAIIYNGTTGHIVMESTGSYDSATNKFVTGNGMMNVLLPAATYTVELYYTE